MTPQPSPRFWDRVAKRYAARPVADEAAYEKKLQVTRDYLSPNMNVLEFGCGTGSTAISHSRFVGHIHAIDISSNMLEIAAARAAENAVENIRFEQSTIEELSVADDSFDAVLGLSILHLLADKEAAMAKVYRMLKPGGLFISSTVCIGDSMKFFRYVAPLGRVLGLIPLVTVFTAAELVASLTETGFQIDYEWRPDKGKAVFIVAKKPTLQAGDNGRP